MILEKDNPDIQLTEKFQMVFFELPKFEKHLEKVADNLELWLYIIKNTSSIDEEEMRIIVDKSPSMRETLGELKKISIDPQLLSLEEACRKADLDYNSRLGDSFRAGEKKGIEKGMEKGVEKGMAEVAKAMLAKGLALSDISGFTGLSEVEITKLKCEMDQD